MKISIIGAGGTGLSAATYLHLQSQDVKVYVRNEKKRAFWNTHPLNVRGKVNTSLFLPMASTMKEAADFGELLLICTRANDHEAVVEELSPHLREGQTLVFLNGTWGAVKAERYFQKSKSPVAITIAETANMPFIASVCEDLENLHFKALKEEIGYAVIGEDEKVSKLLHQLAPKVTRVSSPASTSLSATNPIIHCTTCLFNMTRIENGEDFHFFAEAMPKRVTAYMEACDKERLAIGKALGVELSPLLSVLNSFWNSRAATLHEALTTNISYAAVKGPTEISSRYLSEDLPCGLMSLLDLADMMHVQAPHLYALAYTLSLYLQQPVKPFLTPQDLRVIKSLK